MKHRFAFAVSLISLLLAFGTVAEPEKGKGFMASRSDCLSTPVKRSICMVQAVLDDVQKTYAQIGGGGISDIRFTATDTCTVSIAQEERIDLITYELRVDASGRVVVKKRTEGTKSPGR